MNQIINLQQYFINDAVGYEDDADLLLCTNIFKYTYIHTYINTHMYLSAAAGATCTLTLRVRLTAAAPTLIQ